ncbi:MAG: FtsX-like permease family protein [Bacteroidetes bacterium]|nr:MAG: FtsX-like permease family protein [Bacteroidota bacterium]
MATAVIERKKEIGIMKSIGAKNRQIFFLFLVESGLMGFVGGIIGVAFGIGIGYFGIKFINNFLGSLVKPTINYTLIFLVLIGSFIIGALSGIIPAMNAAKQNPIEAIK